MPLTPLAHYDPGARAALKTLKRRTFVLCVLFGGGSLCAGGFILIAYFKPEWFGELLPIEDNDGGIFVGLFWMALGALALWLGSRQYRNIMETLARGDTHGCYARLSIRQRDDNTTFHAHVYERETDSEPTWILSLVDIPAHITGEIFDRPVRISVMRHPKSRKPLILITENGDYLLSYGIWKGDR